MIRTIGSLLSVLFSVVIAGCLVYWVLDSEGAAQFTSQNTYIESLLAVVVAGGLAVFFIGLGWHLKKDDWR